MQVMAGKRGYGTGELYEKHGSYYGRWRTSDGRKLNRKVGPVRAPGSAQGLTRPKAERAFRAMQEAEELRPSRRRGVESVTVGAAAASLQRAKALEGARKSYLENLDSMRRIHLEPTIGPLPLETVTPERIERLGSDLLASGRAAKTVRNVLTFAHSVFEHAIANGWCEQNPVRHAARPKRRRSGRRKPRPAVPDRRRARSGAARDPRRRRGSGAGADPARSGGTRATAASRRSRAGAAGPDPRGRDHRPAPVRAARPALA